MAVYRIRYKGHQFDSTVYVEAYSQSDAEEYAKEEAKENKMEVFDVSPISVKHIS